ncbi:hypothetical protein DF057_28805 [Burkholderia cepacia]|nr:hypothetical protein DF057_28805 [Burkholderia cepacia]
MTSFLDACRVSPHCAALPGRTSRPAFFHRLQRWVLGVTGGRRHNQACSAGTSCYPLPYASRAPTLAAFLNW